MHAFFISQIKSFRATRFKVGSRRSLPNAEEKPLTSPEKLKRSP